MQFQLRCSVKSLKAAEASFLFCVLLQEFIHISIIIIIISDFAARYETRVNSKKLQKEIRDNWNWDKDRKPWKPLLLTLRVFCENLSREESCWYHTLRTEFPLTPSVCDIYIATTKMMRDGHQMQISMKYTLQR